MIKDPEKLFTEEYEVGQQVGGMTGFGKVYRCRRKSDRKIFVVKAISKRIFFRSNENVRERQSLLSSLIGELDILRTIKGQIINIANLEKTYQDKYMIYIVIEEMRGGNLYDYIIKLYKTNGRNSRNINESNIANIFKSIVNALKFMHDVFGIIHCNLKPNNILFTRNNIPKLKITDFGMSKILSNVKYLQQLNETPYYIAPEIWKSDIYSKMADMWSVGILLFIVLVGFPPFNIDPTLYYGSYERLQLYRIVWQCMHFVCNCVCVNLFLNA